MKTADLEVHRAAKLLPMMSGAELAELAADLTKHGQVHPIVAFEGKLLDGRNRLAACKLAGIDPWITEWDGRGGTPTAYAVSANLPRRHLTKDQRAMAAVDVIPLFEAEAAERMRAGKRTLKPPANPTATVAVGSDESAGKKKRAPTAAAQAAQAFGVPARQVERAKELKTKRPDLAQLVRESKETLNSTLKSIKREQQDKQVLEYRPPAGKFSVIVTDCPWRYDDQLEGEGARSGVQYPTMSVDEICAMKLGDTKAADDCALWFWVTNAFLIDGTAATVLAAWGFEPKTLLTWRKVDSKGKDRLGAGHYLRNVTEHCILAVRGKPVIRGADVPNIFDAPRRGHSEKPDEFFKIVEKVCPAPAEARLELFARKDRDGWVTSGAEKPKSKVREPVTEAVAAELKPELDQVARVTRAAFAPITWFAMKQTPLVARGQGRTGQYEVYRRGRDFRWALTHEHGEPVRGWPESPGFASIDEAKADAEAIEEMRQKTLPPPLAGMAEPAARKPRRENMRVRDVPEPEPAPATSWAHATQAANDADVIAWVEKKHPTKVAVGNTASRRRYAINKLSKRSASTEHHKGGKKIDGYVYRWFCASDGASSLEEFDTIELAKAGAVRAERSWLAARTSAA